MGYGRTGPIRSKKKAKGFNLGPVGKAGVIPGQEVKNTPQVTEWLRYFALVQGLERGGVVNEW